MSHSGNVCFEWNGPRWSPISVCEKLEGRKAEGNEKISSSFDHCEPAFISSHIINGQEQLIFCCTRCDDIKLVDLQKSEWRTAFSVCDPGILCSGSGDITLLQLQREWSILQLDSSHSIFKGPMKTLHYNMGCLAMCYIPPPIDALVVSDVRSSKMFALSVERDMVIWEFQHQKGGIYDHQKERVYDRMGLLFHPEHNVLLVADGIRERVLMVDPGTGRLIQTIDLPDMGYILALGLYNDQLVMLHGNFEEVCKLSYCDLW